jgi:hypothetical protein
MTWTGRGSRSRQQQPPQPPLSSHSSSIRGQDSTASLYPRPLFPPPRSPAPRNSGCPPAVSPGPVAAPPPACPGPPLPPPPAPAQTPPPCLQPQPRRQEHGPQARLAPAHRQPHPPPARQRGTSQPPCSPAPSTPLGAPLTSDRAGGGPKLTQHATQAACTARMTGQAGGWSMGCRRGRWAAGGVDGEGVRADKIPRGR